MDVNWNDLLQAAADVRRDLLPASTYTCKVVGASWNRTSTDKDRLNVQFVVLDGPWRGQSIWLGLVLSPDNPKAVDFFLKRLGALGADRPFLATSPRNEDIARRVVSDQEYTVDVQHREWNDQTMVDVKNFTRLAPSISLRS